MKKYMYSLIGLFAFLLLNLQNVFGEVAKDDILPTKDSSALNPTTGDIDLGSLLSWFRGELTTIVFIIAVGVFVFIGIRMATARGNPEEFKKAWMHFVYAIIGIFIVFLAWGLVSLIANLGSNF